MGIAADQSNTTQLVGNLIGAGLWPLLDEAVVCVPDNPSVRYVVGGCLTGQGHEEEVEFLYANESSCVEGITSVNGTSLVDLGGFSSPFTHQVLESMEGARTLCSGASVNATIMAGHLVQEEFASANPMTVAKVRCIFATQPWLIHRI